MVYRPLSPTPSPIKQRLLTGASVAVIALASAAVLAPAGAWAQTQITGATGAASDVVPGGAVAVISDGDGTQDFGFIDTDTAGAAVAVPSITLSDPDIIRVFDGDGDTANDADAGEVTGDFVVNSGVSGAAVVFGQIADGTAGEVAGLTIGGDLEGAADGRGGDLAISVFDEATVDGDDDATFTVNGSTNMSLLSVTAGSGLTAAGENIIATFGDGGDTFDATGLTVTGGNGVAGLAGGTAEATIATDGGAGVVTIGASGLTVDGGNAGAGGGGGTATLTIADSATVAGTTNVTGGDEGSAAGNGAAAVLDFTDVAGTITLTGALTVATGDAAAAGGSEAGAATSRFASTTINANGGIVLTEDADTTAAATLVLDGNGDQTLTGVITATNDGDGVIEVDNTGGGGTTVTFASSIGASDARVGTITLTDAGTVEFDATVFAGTITTAADTAIAQFDADVDATGVNGTAGTTELDFNANLTIGAGNLRLGTGGGTFAGNIAGTGNIQIDTGDNAEFDGTASQTISTAIVSTGAGTGNVTVSNTSTPGVTFNSTIGTAGNRVGTITLNADANATFNDEVQASALTMTAGAGITINDDAAAATPMVVIIGNGGLTVTDGTINLGNEVGAGDIVFDLTTDAGEDINDAGATDGGTVINLAANFTSGTLTLIDDNDTIVAGDFDQFSVTDTALVDYTLTNAGQDITITAAARTTAETAALLGVSSDQAAALGSAVDAADTGSDDEALAAISTALNAGGTTATNAAEQVGVQGDTQGGASNVAFNAVGQQQTITGNRLASSRSGSQYGTSGFSSGDYYGGPQGGSYWIQGFGGIAMADGDSNAAGYDAGFGGFAVGVDGQFSEDVTVGFFGSYTHSYVEGDGVGQSELSANTYLIGAYSGFSTHNFYFDAFAAYAYADNESSRIVNVGGLDRTYIGDYGSSQVTLAATAGTPFEVGHSVYITPNAGLTWNHYEAEDYTETGTGALTATVDSETVNQLTGTVGARIHAVFDGVDRSGTVFIPELRLGVAFDLIDDDAVSTATFTGGGAAYQTTGTDTDDIGALLGLGLGFDNPDWSANLTYDADLRSDFHSHTARAEVRVKF